MIHMHIMTMSSFNEDRVELLNSMEEQGVGTICKMSVQHIIPAGRLLHLQRNIHLYMRQSGFIRMRSAA